jgi:hypothetical protein
LAICIAFICIWKKSNAAVYFKWTFPVNMFVCSRLEDTRVYVYISDA